MYTARMYWCEIKERKIICKFSFISEKLLVTGYTENDANKTQN